MFKPKSSVDKTTRKGSGIKVKDFMAKKGGNKHTSSCKGSYKVHEEKYTD